MFRITLPEKYEKYVKYLPESVITEMLIEHIEEHLNAEPKKQQESLDTDELVSKLQALMSSTNVKVSTEQKPVDTEPISIKNELKIGEHVQLESADTDDDVVNDFLLDILK